MDFDVTTDSLQALFNTIKKRFNYMRFTSKSQLAFLEDLYTLVNDGIPANRAIEMMAHVTTGISKDVALSIAQKISEGRPLADGMREWFPLGVVEIIHVGEEGGALNETIRSAMNTLGQRTSTFSALMGAITYPLFVIIMGCIVIIYLNETVFVQFKEIKPFEEWPEAGRDFVSLANTLERWWWLVILGAMGIVIFFRSLLNNYTGELRTLLDKFPPFSLYRRLAAARLMETMGLLVANGVVFKNAIKVMQYQANPYIAYHLSMMEHLLSTGKGNLADVLSTGLIDDEDIMRMRVMAEVKGFEHGLIRMGIRGSEKSNKALKLIGRIVGGIFLGIGAYLILVIVRGIYLTGMSMGVA